MTLTTTLEDVGTNLYCFPYGDDLFTITPIEGDGAWLEGDAGRTSVTFHQGRWITDEEWSGSEM